MIESTMTDNLERSTKIKRRRLLLLQNMPVFGGISEETLRFILQKTPIISVSKGEFFFHEDEEGDAAYVLEEGRIKFLKNYQGQNYLMRVLSEGDCFGEMAMIGLYPRSGSAQAIEDCRAIKITSGILHEIHEKNPEQFTLILMNMARDLSRRLRNVDNLLLGTLAKHHLREPE